MSDGLPASNPTDSHTPVPAAGEVAPPAFGRYRLTRKLGTGSFGEVWRADDLFLGEPVALKFLNQNFTGQATALHDLKREVRTLRRLSHPNIVRVHDLVYDKQHTAIVMEFIDGRTLAEILAASPKGCLQPEDIEVWLPQLASVFDYLHRSEAIIHSDIKPLNLMLTSTGRLKVADFGLASTLAASTSYITGTGARQGTLAYMSPQQMRGSRPSVADDIHALGATLFHLLTGTTPFHGSGLDLMSPDKTAPTVAARRHETGKGRLTPVPNSWESAIAACLAKDARLRPNSVRDVVRWLIPDPGSPGHDAMESSLILPPASPRPQPKRPASGWQPLPAAAAAAAGSGPPIPTSPPTEAIPVRPPAAKHPAPAQVPPRNQDSTMFWMGILLASMVVLLLMLVLVYIYV